MPDDNGLPGGVGLSEAIEALRAELTQSMITGVSQGLRFTPGPVELTVQAALTKGVEGKAGIKWWLIEAGGEASRQSSVTQTLKIILQPVMLDQQGGIVDVLIHGIDDSPTGSSSAKDSETGGGGGEHSRGATE